MLPLLVNIEFQVLFHSAPAVLFTFPSQYYALSVTEEYLGLGGGPPGFPQGFSCLVVLWILLGFGQISLTGFSPSLMRLSRLFSYLSSVPHCSPQPQSTSTLVWPVSLSLATTQEIDVSFSSCRYLDVSVPCVPSVWLWIGHTVTEVCSVRFPHSDILGSKLICSSPKLFAAYRVLHRLSVPRHPLYALSSLTYLVNCFLLNRNKCLVILK